MTAKRGRNDVTYPLSREINCCGARCSRARSCCLKIATGETRDGRLDKKASTPDRARINALIIASTCAHLLYLQNPLFRNLYVTSRRTGAFGRKGPARGAATAPERASSVTALLIPAEGVFDRATMCTSFAFRQGPRPDERRFGRMPERSSSRVLSPSLSNFFPLSYSLLIRAPRDAKRILTLSLLRTRFKKSRFVSS